ncbi:MAG: HK97 family phage prohead protease [Thiotrichales bacterium]|nr:HK97 family phage prohead protease [Thiotrichales bacterium]
MIEHRDGVEFRVAGRTLSGRALVYGDVSPDFRETFVPGSLAPVPAVPLNLQHDSGTVLLPAGEFVLNDTERALEVRAELRAGSAALDLVRRGALNGFSIEFHARAERRDAGVRVIERAALVGIALVDRPSYRESTVTVEMRRRGGGGGRGSRGGRLGTFRGRVPARKRMQCQCGPKGCFDALFKQRALRGVVDSEDEILAVWGDYGGAVGSRKRRTVRFWEGEDGSLEYAVDIPNTEAGRTLKENLEAKAVDIVARPVIDTDASDFTIVGQTAEYSSVKVRALTVGATDRDAGWPPIYLRERDTDDVPDNAPEPSATTRRRARIWL